MTAPITPDPAIHDSSRSTSQASSVTLSGLASNLMQGISQFFLNLLGAPLEKLSEFAEDAVKTVFTNLFGAIGTTVHDLGDVLFNVESAIAPGVKAIINGIQAFLTQLVDAIVNGLGLGSASGNIVTDIENVGHALASDVQAALQIAGKAWTAVQKAAANITTAVESGAETAWDDIESLGEDVGHAVGTVVGNIENTIKNLSNTWFGNTASTGQPADVITVVEAIKVAVENGYTMETFPTSTTGWVIPTGINELNGVCINPGNNGTSGSSSGAGGAFGQGGSYVVMPIDLSGYTLGTSTLNFTVGAPGSGSGASGGTSEITDSSGTVLVSGTAGLGGIPTALGWGTSSGSGGNGGAGGNATNSPSATSGANGSPSAVAAGGTGGTGHTATGVGSVAGGTGAVGGNGTTDTAPLCAGAGGGGGGGAGTNTGSSLMSSNGGNGGNGGYPGGGGGGGGGSVSTYNNNPGGYGYGGNGFTAVLYK